MTSAPDTTLYVALHGELTPHPWRDPSTAASDAYSLFVARSSAMGWLRDPPHDGCGLWGMNDAAYEPAATRVAWFQASLPAHPSPSGTSPVQPFLACVRDVVTRLGTLHLKAAQILLPPTTHEGTPRTEARLLQEAGWFTDLPPQARTAIRVTLDSGQNPAIRSAAPHLLAWLRDLKQDVLTDLSLTHDDPITLRPAITDTLWHGPAHHHITLNATLPEWSLDAIAWLATLLTDASHQHNINTPLLLSTARDAAPPLLMGKP
ncbi:hypothetical protein AB0C27_52355 [Nonomuraea sp. NPDC048882]|uniref:hypothetical protein n=1 Tax=Nonomuraea sp. NPDC048882 TaxID=3154347 RepID=UPI0033D5C471